MSKKKSEPSKPAASPAQTSPASPDIAGQGMGILPGLRHEIDRLFDEFDPWNWGLSRRQPLGRLRSAMAPMPAMDLVERDGDFELTAELPGMSADDVEVKVTDGTLSIRGEKTEERKTEEKNYHLSERSFGAFHRRFKLPPGADPDAIDARFADGVLRVTMPKTPEARDKERKIAIKPA
jgi:HSP20 family protein